MTKAHKQQLEASKVCKQTGLIVIEISTISSGCKRAVGFLECSRESTQPFFFSFCGIAVKVLQ